MGVRRTQFIIPVLAGILILVTLGIPNNVYAQINSFTDFASFDAATGDLTEIDFENLNSITVDDVTFRDPLDLRTGFCSSPTCQIDPDNPIGNTVLFLNSGGDITFPLGTDSATLIIEGMGSATFSLEVTDFSGGTSIINGQGIPFGVLSQDLTTANGVQKATVISTSGGPIVLSAVQTFDNTNTLVSDIDFEDLPPSGVCILSVCTDVDPSGNPSLPEPLVLERVSFSDPFKGQAFCSSPTCQIDPDNPIGNIVLFLNTGGTIDFPPGTLGAMLVIEGMGDNTFTVEVTEFGGTFSEFSGSGISFNEAFLGFTSAQGIQQIEVLGTGGGPIAISSLFFEPPSADLSLTKTDSIDPVTAGNSLTYTLTVNNEGPSDAANVVVSDTLPAGVTLVSVISSQGGCVSLPCNLGTIPNGGSATVTVNVTVDLGTSGTLTNTASVTSDTNDIDNTNNTATEDTISEAGVPEDPQPPEDPTPPEEPGPTEDPTPPEEPGPPETPGPPPGTGRP